MKNRLGLNDVATPNFEYPKDVRFKCMRCALCCGDTEHKIRSILLLKSEAKCISEKTSKSISEFAEKIDGFQPYIYIMKKTPDGKCVFLRENSCTIYKIRPLICMFYPFELKKNERNKYAFTCTAECPSVGKGPKLTKEFFQKLFRKSIAIMKENRKN